MAYEKKMAERNRTPYSICRKIFLDRFTTYIQSTPDGYELVHPSGTIRMKDGKIHISGNMTIEDETPLSLQHVQGISYAEDSPKTLWKNEKYNISSAIGYWRVEIGGREGVIPIFPMSKIDDKIIITKGTI